MASKMTTKDFFASGTPQQFDFALSHYDKALRLKAESKSSKPENVIKLDKWYQNELPKKIKSRGKDAHLVHDELVQTIKWKLARGKFRPNLVNLVQMNTPRVVQQETKKAFRNLQKKNDLQSASNALCNLKGVGPGLASAVLAAGAPHIAPFMADECLLAMPDVDSLDYTMKEYMRFVEYVKACVERLNSDGSTTWTPHKVELAVWTHYILRDLKPDLLVDMPEADAPKASASSEAKSSESSANNGATPTSADDEDTKFSMASSMGCDEDSNSVLEPPSSASAIVAPSEDESNSMAASEVVAKNGSSEEETPKTNGSNNSHSSNGSNGTNAEEAKPASESATQGDQAEVAKENGDKEEDKAKAAAEQTQANGELENGVKSSEKESTDLTSSSPSCGKRPLDEASSEDSEAKSSEASPAAKKLKTCEEDASDNNASSTTTENPTPQVAV